jgi:hypothetical protein
MREQLMAGDLLDLADAAADERDNLTPGIIMSIQAIYYEEWAL